MKIEQVSLLRRLVTFGADPKSEERIRAAIAVSDSLYNLEHVTISISNTTNPRHEVSQTRQTVFLPDRHFELPIFNRLRKKFGTDIYPRFVAYHEFGHAVQIARTANGQTVDIKEDHANLHYLFNGSAVPNKINNFMKELFKEGFADCYAALCLYKETGDISVFNKITEIRSKRYHEIKRENHPDFIHPNFNVNAADYLGKAVSTLVANGKDLFDLPFVATGTGKGASLEKYIQRAVIAGSVAALLRELRTNDAFLNHFRSFARDFRLDEHRVMKILAGEPNLSEVLAYEKTRGISSYFLELTKRLPSFCASVLTDHDIRVILDNKEYRRQTDANLVLMDVVEIPYSAGLEGAKGRVRKLRGQYLNPCGKMKPGP
uniref:Uncharacterized protein n=1 Tax=Ralstonia solanacearum TaxID=305 RepID=A0A0S4WQH5_RALSL|nr:protein of unknown function [Ralstonia solanacearum]